MRGPYPIRSLEGRVPSRSGVRPPWQQRARRIGADAENSWLGHHGPMSETGPLNKGRPIEWVGAPYVEDAGRGRVVRPGDVGSYISPDGESQYEGIVVSFEATGPFCCPLTNVRPISA